MDGKPPAGADAGRSRPGAELSERHVLSVFANIKVACPFSCQLLSLLTYRRR